MGFKFQSQVCRLCFGKEFYIHMYIWVYLHIYKEIFPKTWSLNLALTFETHLFGMALNAFFKAALYAYTHTYIHIYINRIYICIYIIQILFGWNNSSYNLRGIRTPDPPTCNGQPERPGNPCRCCKVWSRQFAAWLHWSHPPVGAFLRDASFKKCNNKRAHLFVDQARVTTQSIYICVLLCDN